MSDFGRILERGRIKKKMCAAEVQFLQTLHKRPNFLEFNLLSMSCQKAVKHWNFLYLLHFIKTPGRVSQ